MLVICNLSIAGVFYPTRRTSSLMKINYGNTLAFIISPLLVSLLLYSGINWRYYYLVHPVLLIILGLILWRMDIPETIRVETSFRKLFTANKRIVANPSFLLCGIILFFYVSVMNTFYVWFTSYFSGIGIDINVSSLFLSIYGAAIFAGMILRNKLIQYFKKKRIPVIFTSEKKRTIETAEPVRDLQGNCGIIPLREFNEIDSGVCECMSYEEIRKMMPRVYMARKKDKYNYIYPEGEGYASMEARIERGIKKALYLSSSSQNIMIVGHSAVNRMILSHFLYRRKDDVPFTYIPQDKFYHIVATQDKKLFQLKAYA